MEASTLIHTGHAGLRSPAPLLRLHGDEKLVALTRRGSHQAYEALVARYQSRLLAFCRHMLGSREDAEDVLQEVFAAAFNAMLADKRPINVRPWLYRIARNRCLNHLRRAQAVGVDSMDVHFAEHGATTAEKVHDREDFRLLIADVQSLPETQRTALLLREIDALSYEQIAEAMETTVPGIKSLLVRARVSLAEAAEARLLSCDEVRLELGEVAEGLKRTSPPVRRHLRSCERCATFKRQLHETNKALAAMFPVGPLLLFKKFVLTHAGAAGAGGATATATAGASVAGSAAAGSALSTGLSALATKAAAGLAAAAIVTAGAVEVNHPRPRARPVEQAAVAAAPVPVPVVEPAAPVAPVSQPKPRPERHKAAAAKAKPEPAPAQAAPAQPASASPTTDGQQPAATEPQREYDSTALPQPASPGASSGGAVAPEERPAPTAAVPTAGPVMPAPAQPPAAQPPADPAPPAQQPPAQDAPPPAPPAGTPLPAPDVAPPADLVPPPAS